jgi:hypothetical protein
MKGDRLIAVGETLWYHWEDSAITKFSVQEDLTGTSEDEHVTGCFTADPHIRDKRPLYLEHDDGIDLSDSYQVRKGQSFMIPWVHCKQWKVGKSRSSQFVY